MQLPAALPPELQKYGSAASETELLDKLKEDVETLGKFFAYACDDETWCSDHDEFVVNALKILTEKFATMRLSLDVGRECADAICRHLSNLKNSLPLDVECEILSQKKPISSLMFGAKSTFFRHIIFKKCYEAHQRVFFVQRVSAPQFKIIEEYIYTDDVKDLKNTEFDFLPQMTEVAYKLDLPYLGEICQKVMCDFVNEQNAFKMLSLAFTNSWKLLEKRCVEIINSDDPELQISFLKEGSLSCHLANWTEHTVDNVQRIKKMVTQIVCGSIVANEIGFWESLIEYPKLRSIDIGQSDRYPQYLGFLPDYVSELSLSGCNWLDDTAFKLIVNQCSFIQKLDLTNCNQLSAIAWGELLKFPNLVSLNISRCDQLTDDGLSIIIDAAQALEQLYLDGCSAITDSGFRNICRCGERLTTLSVAQTSISNASIIELIDNLPSLRVLSIAGCSHISEEGIMEVLRIGSMLEVFDCTSCYVPTEFLESMHERYPNIKLLS